jgi:nitroimidazol reductase NimA-like FMN-containing flavoprotein (pyridoxamine 5'-phosphate oxidase superfamily)
MTDLRSADARLVAMSAYECWQQLEAAENLIARVVWVAGGRPGVLPVNFTVADGAVWFQTNAESPLGRHCEGQRILVEVDHAEPSTHAGWSVIVAGPAEFVDVDDAAELLERLRVWPKGPRNVFVRVEPEEVTGRRLVPRSS